MNVFDAICLNDLDPIERDFIAIETVYEIAVAKAEKDYALDNGLISFSSNDLFTEAADAKKSSTSKSFFQSICDAVSSFLSGIVDAITKIFSGKSEKDITDNSNIKLNKDIKKYNEAVDQEMAKGRKLIANGASDSEADNWIAASTKKLAGIASVAVPVATAFGLNKLIKSFTTKKDEVMTDATKEAEKISDEPNKVGPVRKIIRHMGEMAKGFGTEVRTFGTRINEYYKTRKADAKTEYKGKKGELTNLYGDTQAKFATGQMTEDEYMSEIQGLSAKEDAAVNEYIMKVKNAKSKREQDVGVQNVVKKALAALDRQAHGKYITKNKCNSFKELIVSYRNKYEAGDMDYDEVIRRIGNIIKNK